MVQHVERSQDISDLIAEYGRAGMSRRDFVRRAAALGLSVPAAAALLAAFAVQMRLLCNVLDDAIQMHGARGYSDDLPFAWWYRFARAARIADGPDGSTSASSRAAWPRGASTCWCDSAGRRHVRRGQGGPWRGT